MSFLLGEVAPGTGAVDAIKTVFTDITATINIATVVQVLGIVAASAIGLVLLWWGARKVTRVIMNAFKKGKISF